MDRRRLIISIIILAAIVLVVIFLILPQWSNVTNLQSQINSTKAELSQKTDLAKKLDEMLSKYDEVFNKVQKVDFVVPKDSQRPELIVQLESLAKDNGLVLSSLEFSEAPKKEGEQLKTLNISLALAGTYEAFKNFILSAEQNLRIMDIESVSFSAPEKVVASGILPQVGGPITNELKFNVRLNAYYQ